jgi:hypothetical protein
MNIKRKEHMHGKNIKRKDRLINIQKMKKMKNKPK